MKSWRGQVSFVGLATVAVALFVHGCQSPESFHLTPDADDTVGTGGDDGGSGGVGSGGKGSGGSADGTGGHGTGGVSGTGGVAIGTGGRASGGSGGVVGPPASGGVSALGGHGGTPRGTGGTGRGGTGGTGQGGRGGRSGSGGVGGRGGSHSGGAGGRAPFGFSGNTCLTDLQANGYAYGTAPGCSACNDNGMSLEAKCQAVIDCMAPQWPCTGNCATQCYNMASASGPVMTCVSALTTAACGM